MKFVISTKIHQYRNQVNEVTINGNVWSFSLSTRGETMVPISHLIGLLLSLKENEEIRVQITTSVKTKQIIS